ncbi:MAG: hypothetical protein OK438_06110 [Thaumarchaeota archaeon]|nr:hypothetical protein [Nitrososphaerota archaeon]
MGSFFAGIKAGTLAGTVYLGGFALFNVLLLFALKADALAIISQNFSQSCLPATPGTSVEDCFDSVVAVYIPLIAVIGFFVALLYAGLFGRFYERIPGRTQLFKGEVIAVVVGLSLLFIGLTGFAFDYIARVSLGVFFFVWTVLYGYFLARLYRKYTRLVRFESQDPTSIRVLVGRKDYTGKAVTLAHTSTHQIRAEVADDASFKEWTVSGGITVDDARSFETAMEIGGDGLLKVQGGKKY